MFSGTEQQLKQELTFEHISISVNVLIHMRLDFVFQVSSWCHMTEIFDYMNMLNASLI